MTEWPIGAPDQSQIVFVRGVPGSQKHWKSLRNEVGDVALDLRRWQVVAGDGDRLAEIAADDEGAQPRPGEAFRLCDAEPAHHLHRGSAADRSKMARAMSPR